MITTFPCSINKQTRGNQLLKEWKENFIDTVDEVHSGYAPSGGFIFSNGDSTVRVTFSEPVDTFSDVSKTFSASVTSNVKSCFGVRRVKVNLFFMRYVSVNVRLVRLTT